MITNRDFIFLTKGKLTPLNNAARDCLVNGVEIKDAHKKHEVEYISLYTVYHRILKQVKTIQKALQNV